MSEPVPQQTIHRVLLTMDSPSALSLLPAAVELAARMRAELQGLFVEDANLLRLSALPFAQEICSSSAVARPLTLELVERRLRALAEQLRASLANSAQRAQVAWSFQVARGANQCVSLESTRDVDLVLVGHRLPPRPTARSRGAGRSAPMPSSRLPIAVLFDGSPASQRALSIACQAATWHGVAVEVILAASDAPAESLRASATKLLVAHGAIGRFAPDAVGQFDELRSRLETRKCGLVLLPADSPLVADVTLAQLAGEVGTLIGLVR